MKNLETAIIKHTNAQHCTCDTHVRQQVAFTNSFDRARYSSQGEGKFSRFNNIQIIPESRMIINFVLIFLLLFLFFKIDVNSFGVLLCEMCTFKQFTDPQKRLAQVNMVRDNGLRELVRRCLKTNPKERLDITEIISELKRLLLKPTARS